MAKLERIKRLKNAPMDIVAKLPKKRLTKKERDARDKVAEEGKKEEELTISISSIPMPRRSSTYVPPSPGEHDAYHHNHPGFDPRYEYYDYESTPGEMEMSPVDGYFGSHHGTHYSSDSSLNQAMEQYSFSYQYPPQESPYPVTPESASIPNSPTYTSPGVPHAHSHYHQETGEPLFPTKEHFAHRPSLSRSYSTPVCYQQQSQPYPFPASPYESGAQQPAGLCMYIAEGEHGRSAPAYVHHEELQQQQSMQAWTFPSTKPATVSQRANQLAPMHFQQCTSAPRPPPTKMHLRTVSSPLVHEYKPVYSGPIDWTSRPLMPFPAQKLRPPAARPTHERTYSEYGTSSSISTTTVQTVRLAEICQTNGQH